MSDGKSRKITTEKVDQKHFGGKIPKIEGVVPLITMHAGETVDFASVRLVVSNLYI